MSDLTAPNSPEPSRSDSPSPAPLPPMRESSRLGVALRRYLLAGTLLLLGLMGWGAVVVIDTLDLDLSIPTVPTLPGEAGDAAPTAPPQSP